MCSGANGCDQFHGDGVYEPQLRGHLVIVWRKLRVLAPPYGGDAGVHGRLRRLLVISLSPACYTRVACKGNKNKFPQIPRLWLRVGHEELRCA
eukprot:2347510-Prymnesium_polylepis.1